MLNIKTFEVNPLGEQCYVASDETGEAVIVDCGCSTESEWADIKRYIAQENLQVRHLLNTHLHFDHVWGTTFAHRDLGLYPEAHYADLPIYEHMDEQIRSVVGMSLPHPSMPPLGTSLKEGSQVRFGQTTLTVLSTPGHTQGCICFYSEADQVLFAGDTLFCGSCGRTDLEGGDFASMLFSLRRLATLPDTVKVYSGHGPATTIGHEKRFNPYMN